MHFYFGNQCTCPNHCGATGNLPATFELFSVTNAVVDPTDPTTAIETALSLLAYPIFGANDLIATAGGIPYDNRSTTYNGSADDAALKETARGLPIEIAGSGAGKIPV